MLGALDRRNLPMAPFYMSQLLFILLPFALMVPGTIFFLVVYRPCTKEERESKDN